MSQNPNQGPDYAGPQNALPTATAAVWSVGALCAAIARSLQAQFNPVTVQGEVSGFSRASSGHAYFQLKDAGGQLRCAMFKRSAMLLGFTPVDGDRVLVRARLDVYPSRGDLQLIVESMEKAGQGALYEQYLQIKARLQAMGLFETSRKRSLPLFPRAIGVVTSLGAAALRDVVTTLRRRVPHIPVVVVNSVVQGAQAANELVRALDQMKSLTPGSSGGAGANQTAVVDVVLMVRGGGSIEDLWAFNDERLAHAIANFPVPIVAGIGHETDFTIADFVADLRAATPTAAAQLVCASQAEVTGVLENLSNRLEQATWSHLDAGEQRLDTLAARLGRPSDRLHRQQIRLAALASQLHQKVSARSIACEQGLNHVAAALPKAVAQGYAVHQRRLDVSEQALRHLDPKTVLARGFSWLADQDGQAITSVQSVAVGQAVAAHLVDGVLDLTINRQTPLGGIPQIPGG